MKTSKHDGVERHIGEDSLVGNLWIDRALSDIAMGKITKTILAGIIWLQGF